jgi:hypothetical protein
MQASALPPRLAQRMLPVQQSRSDTKGKLQSQFHSHPQIDLAASTQAQKLDIRPALSNAVSSLC